MSDDSPDGSILGLGRTVDDLDAREVLILITRRLAQQEVQIRRIADALELQLKLSLVQQNMSVEHLKAFEWDAGKPAPEGKPAMELLTQSPDEIEELSRAYELAEQRMGKGNVPLELDLYAEMERQRPDNPEEEV